jgi:hypothetical protein
MHEYQRLKALQSSESFFSEKRAPISWEDRYGLRPLYKKLAQLREELPALRRGRFIPLLPPDHPSAFAFIRDAGGPHQTLVVLNFGGPLGSA